MLISSSKYTIPSFLVLIFWQLAFPSAREKKERKGGGARSPSSFEKRKAKGGGGGSVLAPPGMIDASACSSSSTFRNHPTPLFLPLRKRERERGAARRLGKNRRSGFSGETNIGPKRREGGAKGRTTFIAPILFFRVEMLCVCQFPTPAFLPPPSEDLVLVLAFVSLGIFLGTLFISPLTHGQSPLL